MPLNFTRTDRNLGLAFAVLSALSLLALGVLEDTPGTAFAVGLFLGALTVFGILMDRTFRRMRSGALTQPVGN